MKNLRRPLPWMLVLAAVAGVLAAVAAVVNHRNFGTALFDLAVYDNVLWHTIHGRILGSSFIPGGYHFGTHFDPILVALAPVYAVWPRAETLLVVQALWLASGAIPLFLLARRWLGDGWQALALAVALLLHPALHGPLFYDFHSLSLAGPFFLWALYCLNSGRRRTYAVIFVLILLTREDMALLLVPVGIYAFAVGERGLGRLTIAGALLYFAAVKLALTLWGHGGGSFAYYYADLVSEPGGNFGHLAWAVVSNPIKALLHVLGGPQLRYLAVMFLPLLGLPFLARRGRYLLVYGLAATLLASRGAMHSVHFQYTTLIYPFAFVLAVDAIVRLSPDPLQFRRRRILVTGVLLACAAAGLGFGALAPNPSFRAGYAEFRPRPDADLQRQYADLERMRAIIPGDAALEVSWNVAPHVSNRYEIEEFPWNWGAEWLLLRADDLGTSEAARWRRDNLELLRVSGAYELLDQGEGGLTLWRRRPDTPLPDRLPDP